MSKIITVFGATGNQGGSVIKHILADAALSKEFKIRGVTRDTTKPAAILLSNQGVELVQADLGSKESIASAIKGSHTIFLVTNYWETASAEIETTQGRNAVDVAKELGISHIIFSSLLNVTEVTGGRLTQVPHFDSKAGIEAYIRASGVPATFILPGYFMTNFTQMLRKEDDSSYSLAYPVSKEAKFPLFHPVEDTGKFVVPVLKRPDQFNGKQIYAATDYYSVERIIAEFEEVTGKKVNFVQVSAEQYKSFLPPQIADEMLENHLFIEEPGYFNGASLEESLSILESKPVAWKDYIKQSGAFA